MCVIIPCRCVKIEYVVCDCIGKQMIDARKKKERRKPWKRTSERDERKLERKREQCN